MGKNGRSCIGGVSHTFTLQGGKKKHDILISSAGTSKHASPSAPRRELCDEEAYTLDRGRGRNTNMHVGRDRLQSDKSGTGPSLVSLNSHYHEFSDMSDGKQVGESGGDTPSLADHSGNNTPAGPGRKSKVTIINSMLTN